MEVSGLSSGRELICALAGPAGGLLLLVFARIIPRTALCGAMQAVFNLLPVYPLDGGRALHCCTDLIFPWDVGEKICNVVERICLFGMVGLGIWGTFVLHLGLLPLGVSLLMLKRSFVGKRPCKLRRFSVQ